MEIAEEYYQIEKLDRPRYRRPSFLKIDGKTCLEKTESSEQVIMMKTGMLHLDWIEYVFNQTKIKYDEELFQKAREETAKYYSGEIQEFSRRVRKLQHFVLKNDIA
jgi:hypothetical protein